MKKYLSEAEVERIDCGYIYKKERCGGNAVFMKQRLFCEEGYINVEFHRHNNQWSISNENKESALERGVSDQDIEKILSFLNDKYIQKKELIDDGRKYRDFYLGYEDADLFGYYEESSPEYIRVKYLLDNIESGSLVYDVACNSGGIGRILKQEKKCEVFGSELCPSLAEKAREKGLIVYCGFAEDADFDKTVFDYVVMSFILEHVIDPDILMRNSLKKLKEGGKLIGCVPTEFGDWGEHTLKYHPEHLRAYSEKHLFGLFKNFGLKDIQIEKVKLIGRNIEDYYLFSAEK